MPFVTASRSAGAGNRTFSITPSGTDRAVVVFVTTESGVTISSVTCGGNAMTQHGATQPGGYFGTSALIYKIANPTASAQNIVITVSSQSSTVNAIAFAVDGADQTTILRAIASTTGEGPTSSTINPASASGETVLDYMVILNTQPTVGAGQTERATPATQDSNLAWYSCSTEVATGSSTEMSWTMAGGEAWHHLGVSVIAATSGSVYSFTNTDTLNLSESYSITKASGTTYDVALSDNMLLSESMSWEEESDLPNDQLSFSESYTIEKLVGATYPSNTSDTLQLQESYQITVSRTYDIVIADTLAFSEQLVVVGQSPPPPTPTQASRVSAGIYGDN